LVENPIYDFTRKIPEQLGLSAVIFGLILCFFGSQLLMHFFKSALTIGVLIATNLYAYNLYISVDASVPVIIFSIIAVSGLSFALSQFMIEFTKKWAILLISTWLGIILVLTIFKLLKI